MTIHAVDFEKRIAVGGFGGAWGPDYALLHSRVWDKTAATCHTPQELLDAAEALKPRPEGVYVLLNALGASETWGANANGDAFNEWSLLGQSPPAEIVRAIDAWNADPKRFRASSCPPGPYGIKTFVTHAKVYIQHANKDPQASKGDVVAAAYNDYMRRGELIVFVYRDRDPDGVRAIERGDPVPWSMGARLPFDMCAVCLNLARNRTEYCPHLRDALGVVGADGSANVALNPFPSYFDISRVIKPADRSAWTLRKVAEVAPAGRKIFRLGEPWYAKRATLLKETPSENGLALKKSPLDERTLELLRVAARRDMALRDQCGDTPDPQLVEALKAKDGLRSVLGAQALSGVVASPRELAAMLRISGQGLPDRLELGSAASKLLSVVSRDVAKRSLLASHLRGRRRGLRKTAASTPWAPSGDYCRYLGLLRSQLGDVVKIATSPRTRAALDPEYAGTALLTGSMTHGSVNEWLPVIAAVTDNTGDGARRLGSHA